MSKPQGCVASRFRLELLRVPAQAYAWLLVIGGRRSGEVTAEEWMSYGIRLLETDEGWSVSCLDLPGCHSQGETRDEALLNIREAIQLWLEVEAEEAGVKTLENRGIGGLMPRLPGVSQQEAVPVFRVHGYPERQQPTGASLSKRVKVAVQVGMYSSAAFHSKPLDQV